MQYNAGEWVGNGSIITCDQASLKKKKKKKIGTPDRRLGRLGTAKTLLCQIELKLSKFYFVFGWFVGCLFFGLLVLKRVKIKHLTKLDHAADWN